MQTTEPAPEAYSPSEAARRLGCSRQTVDRMLADKILRCSRYGRRVFVSAESVHAFAEGTK